MRSLDGVARFGPDAPESVVEAAFACPLCLHRPAWLVLVDEAHQCACGCVCARCDVVWSVALTADQLLRMALAPPKALAVGGCARGVTPAAADHPRFGPPAV